MTVARRLGVIFAVLALTALAVTPALAANLAQDVPIYPEDFQNGTEEDFDCDDVTVEEGTNLWHFILINQVSDEDSNVQLTATFEDADGDPHVIVVSYDKVVDHVVYHFNITTPSDWFLTGASTNETPASTNNRLNLSHVCLGGPPPEIPEAPFALLLPLLSMAAFGGYFLRNRRRATAGI